jgi:MoxR-like ATPase
MHGKWSKSWIALRGRKLHLLRKSSAAPKFSVCASWDHPQASPLVKKYVRYGVSPRGAQAVVLGAKVIALFAGRYNAAFEDIHAVAPAALRHRLLLNFDGLAEGVTTDTVIDELLSVLHPQVN